jgi:hypothetical protein
MIDGMMHTICVFTQHAYARTERRTTYNKNAKNVERVVNGLVPDSWYNILIYP